MNWYKVVDTRYGELRSAVVEGESMMVYTPLAWTPRRKYGAFIFKSLTCARRFARMDRHREIWRCNTRGSVVRVKRAVMWCDLVDLKRKDVMRMMDNLMDKDFKSYWELEVPASTYMAQSVRLLESVPVTVA